MPKFVVFYEIKKKSYINLVGLKNEFFFSVKMSHN